MSKSKNKSNSPSDSAAYQGGGSLAGLFVRIFWVFIGNLILFFLLLDIYGTPSLISILDIVFPCVVLLVILVRYVDIKHLKGITAFGQPATIEDWRKYAKYYAIISAGLWLLAHTLSLIKK